MQEVLQVGSCYLPLEPVGVPMGTAWTVESCVSTLQCADAQGRHPETDWACVPSVLRDTEGFSVDPWPAPTGWFSQSWYLPRHEQGC